MALVNNPPIFSMDSPMLAKIEHKFGEKRKLAQTRERKLFSIFKEQLSVEETWALKFLYAYMPLNDLADYDGSMFLSHVRRTLEIRGLVPWGKRVPDHLFLHFVLPYRVNNEDIEDSRGILYQELADRVTHLSMEDAILETNHWCHEKATYIGNDLRTVSPMTLIRTALGRCGEQSTLAVAALRSLCIPARQCYTPYWAHTDSNHAWVEAWADGKWHYIGACEPEPRLNQGWFSGPAKRAMLVNTRVPSNYPGPEDITLAQEWYTEINLLDGYAPSRTITVKVKDHIGLPIHGAQVSLQVYNYARFMPIAKLTSNEKGEVSLKTGYGDLFIHASHQERYGESKIRVSDYDVFEIVIDRLEQPLNSVDLEMVPPPVASGDSDVPVSEEERQSHNSRVQEGVRLRKSFEESFLNESQSAEIARGLGLPAERVWNVLRMARGNCREMANFLQEQTASNGEWPLRLLESLNDKDLTDTFQPTLIDHLTGALIYRDDYDDETFARYILCPRVFFEMIGPYKRFFLSEFSSKDIERFRQDPAVLAQYLEDEFEVVDEMTYYKGSATPVGSYQLLKGDRPSRDILFVAACRSFGIPARYHPIERKPQFWSKGIWKDAGFELETGVRVKETETGNVLLLRDPDAPADTAAASYFENFSFARLEQGVYKILFYEHGKSDVYDEPFDLEPGSYRMTAGTRLKDGTVLVRLTHFEVTTGAQLELPLTFRQELAEVAILGDSNGEWAFILPDGTETSIGEMAGKRGAVMAWIEPDREPSKHLIREIGELAEQFESLSIPAIFAVGDDGWTASFDPSSYKGLPPGTVFLRDAALSAMNKAMSRMTANTGGLPLVLVLDGQGRIRYQSSGYKLGIGREVLQTLVRLAE